MDSKSIIHYGEGNTGGTIIPLIPFNCIIDTDFGLLTYIDREYLDKSIFSVDFFNNNHKIIDMISALYYRNNKNPLSICMNDKNNIELADKLYDEFMKEKYKEILAVSMTTEIYNLLELFTITGEIKPTIVYQDDLELDVLQSLNVTKSIQKIKIDELNNIDMYQQFYFKYLDDIYCKTYAKYINTKSVYVARYKTNLSNESKIEIATNEYSTLLYLNRNSINTIDLYDQSKLKGEIYNE